MCVCVLLAGVSMITKKSIAKHIQQALTRYNMCAKRYLSPFRCNLCVWITGNKPFVGCVGMVCRMSVRIKWVTFFLRLHVNIYWNITFSLNTKKACLGLKLSYILYVCMCTCICLYEIFLESVYKYTGRSLYIDSLGFPLPLYSYI